MNIKIFNEGKQIVGLYKTKPLFFSKEFLTYAEEIWQLEFPDKNILLIEHENGMSIHKFEQNCKIDIIDSNLFKCPHKITSEIPMFLCKTLKPKKIPVEKLEPLPLHVSADFSSTWNNIQNYYTNTQILQTPLTNLGLVDTIADFGLDPIIQGNLEDESTT